MSAKLLGLKYDLLSKGETISAICNAIDNNSLLHRGDINVASIVNSHSDITLRGHLNSADIVNFDGMGALIGAKVLGLPVAERITGVDLFSELISVAEKQEYSVFLLGATESVIKQTVSHLTLKHPSLNIAGYHNGYFWDDEEALVKKIKKSKANMLFVGVKSPEKERFISKWKEELGVDFIMGVGGTFDVISGNVKRAPKWMQDIGFEWLYRVFQEPRRMWKRYLITNTKFFFMLLKTKLLSL